MPIPRGVPKNKHKPKNDNENNPRAMAPGIDTDLRLERLLDDNAYAKLVGRAKNLTIGDTWKLNGWSIPSSGDPTPNDDEVLNKLTMEEMKSVADAFEVHIVNHGNTQGWKYTNPTYACGGCTACCAVSVDDPLQL